MDLVWNFMKIKILNKYYIIKMEIMMDLVFVILKMEKLDIKVIVKKEK